LALTNKKWYTPEYSEDTNTGKISEKHKCPTLIYSGKDFTEQTWLDLGSTANSEIVELCFDQD